MISYAYLGDENLDEPRDVPRRLQGRRVAATRAFRAAESTYAHRVRVFLGITGASGAPYAKGILDGLVGSGAEVGICASSAGIEVVATELYGDASLAARGGARPVRRRRRRR